MKLSKIFAVLVLTFTLSGLAVAQSKQQTSQKEGLGVIVSSSEGAKINLFVSSSDPNPKQLYGFIAVPKNQTAKTEDGRKIDAFKFTPRIENNLLRIDVTAMTGTEEQPVASYLAANNEKLRVAEMARYGAEPFEMQITDKNPLPDFQLNYSFPKLRPVPKVQGFGAVQR